MARVVVTQGLEQVRIALRRMESNLKPFVKKFGRTAGGEIRNVARRNINNDTGALAASIHVGVKEKPTEVEVKVTAGRPDIRRGEGKHTTGRAGNKVSLLATNEYAAAHEADSKYMQTAADFSVPSMERAIIKAVRLMLRSI